MDRRDAHISASDGVLRLNRHHVRRQAGVGQIRHEALVVAAPEELDPLAEFRVVTDFDLKADRKSKARPDTVEVIVAGREHDAGQLDALPQVHLHPFHRLGLLRNLGVIAEVRSRVTCLGGGGLRDTFDATGQRGISLAGLCTQGGLGLPNLCAQVLLLPHKLGCRGVGGIIEVIGPISSVERGEHGLKAIIILLGDGIELVVMALRTMRSEAREGP